MVGRQAIGGLNSGIGEDAQNGLIYDMSDEQPALRHLTSVESALLLSSDAIESRSEGNKTVYKWPNGYNGLVSGINQLKGISNQQRQRVRCRRQRWCSRCPIELVSL